MLHKVRQFRRIEGVRESGFGNNGGGDPALVKGVAVEF